MAKTKVGKKKAKGTRCPECQSNQTYIRIKDGTLVCRSCGAVTELVTATIMQEIGGE